MRLDTILSNGVKPTRAGPGHGAGHAHVLPRSWGRRQFLQAAGASTAGIALGSRLVRTGLAEAGPGIGNILPIPTTLDAFGEEIHVQVPPFTGADSDPSTVDNFQGASAIALVDTSVSRRNRKTGETLVLPSTGNHVTFMKGVYRGRDGHVRDGTFSLI
jgi:hypothetical protein